jgi:hypothetical protein
MNLITTRYFLIFILIGSVFPSHAEKLDAELNTANVIVASYSLKELSAAFSPGVNTRCYIAELAKFKHESLPEALNVVEGYQTTMSDTFAITTGKQALGLYEVNDIDEIVRVCREAKKSK